MIIEVEVKVDGVKVGCGSHEVEQKLTPTCPVCRGVDLRVSAANQARVRCLSCGHYGYPIMRPENPLARLTDTVESSSNEGEFYRVTTIGGIPVACTCPGYKYRGRCKHIGR